MDPKREADIRRAAQIRSQVYERARKERKAFERNDPFKRAAKSWNKNPEANGRAGALSSLIGLALLVGFMGWVGSSKKAPQFQEAVSAAPTNGFVESPSAAHIRKPQTSSSALVTEPVSQPEAAPSGQPLPEATEAATSLVPLVVSSPAPRYPPTAIRQRHEGTTTLEVTVGQNGSVDEVSILSSSGFRELDIAAIAAAKSWKFTPAMSNGHATSTKLSVPINFTLNSL